ncbi:MAG: hypothetical protein ABIR24_03505 [Verrucomicrobiota bacterium]
MAGLKSDPSITPATRAKLMAMIRNNGEQVEPRVSPAYVNPGPRLLRRGEVARRLSCSLRTVDKLPLKKVKLPGRTRAAGFLESDVNALITRKD